jgi:GT2 family glycosyltransferase
VPRRQRQHSVPDSTAHTRIAGTPPRVAVIASLYASEDYLGTFLANLAEQTIFHESEFCFVLTEPSAREERRLLDFAGQHPNVTLVIEPERIGIYRAWNVAIESTHAPYLTNANADDLRRRDSLEIQARSLDQHPWVDVAYQEVLYTLDRTLTFDQIEAMGFTTFLPHVTASSLLKGVNAPHNAPMWRRSLHEELGPFDDTFVSAGDFEFWVRCASAGKTFLKTRDPHVAYFVNPAGLSTRPGGRGVSEAQDVTRRYRHLLRYGDMPSYAITPESQSVPRSRAERVTEGAIGRACALRTLEEHLGV